MQVTIDAGSRSDAELIAAALPGQPEAVSRRGYGLVRLRLRSRDDVGKLIPILEGCVQRHNLAWARLRAGDDEWMIRGRVRTS